MTLNATANPDDELTYDDFSTVDCANSYGAPGTFPDGSDCVEAPSKTGTSQPLSGDQSATQETNQADEETPRSPQSGKSCSDMKRDVQFGLALSTRDRVWFTNFC